MGLIPWQRLGFEECRPSPSKSWESSPLYFGSNFSFRLRFLDRLRLLVGGQIMVVVSSRIEPTPRIWESLADMSIPAPGWSPRLSSTVPDLVRQADAD